METVLVTGANGFVGQPLCAEIIRQGGHVRAALQRTRQTHAGIDDIITGGLDGKTDWTHALHGVSAIIHLAARVHVMQDIAIDPLAEFRRVNAEGTANLAQQAAYAGVKRFVYVSSIKVNGENTAATGENKYFSETDPPNPQDPYGQSKWEAEQALQRIAQQTGLEVVIVRPPLVYGAGVKGNFRQMLKVIARGIPLPLASVNNRRSLLYVDNLVDALITCASHTAAAGQTYLVSDGEDISTPDLIRGLAASMNVPARLFPCPPALLRMAAAFFGKSAQAERVLGSLQINSDKMRRDLNWHPPYSLQQGLQTTADWYRTTHL